MFEIELVAGEDAAQAARQGILQALIDHNESQAGSSKYWEMALVVRDEAGAVAGGLFAKAYYGWLFVELLALPPGMRGRGLGRALMDRAEGAARAQGLVGVWLDTFAFQALEFYQRRGYAVFGEIEEHPVGGSRYFLKKRV